MYLSSIIPSLTTFCLLDQIVTHPTASVIRATGHQKVLLCPSVCREEKVQLLSSVMSGEFFPFLIRFGCLKICAQCTSYIGKNEKKMDKFDQGPSQIPQRVLETSDTRGDEKDISRGRRKLLSKRTFRMKKVCGASDFGRFFVMGYAANKHSPFYCHVCQKVGLVLTHGHHDVLRQFQGARDFPRDQYLHVETPVKRV